MEMQLSAKGNQQVILIQGARRLPRFVAAADVDHQAAVVRQDAEELAGKPEKPGHVLRLGNVAILLLEVQGKRWRRDDEVDALVSLSKRAAVPFSSQCHCFLEAHNRGNDNVSV